VAEWQICLPAGRRDGLTLHHVGCRVAMNLTWFMAKSNMFYVYLLESTKNHQIYTGMSSDLKRRMKEHQAGKVRTTNRLLPVRLIFYESFLDERDAIRRENYLKTNKGKSTIRMMLQYSLKKDNN